MEKKEKRTKYLPKLGEQLYLRQFTGDCYVDAVKRPYTVVGVSNNEVQIQACTLIAPIYHSKGIPGMDRPDLEGKRVFFYDTIAEEIQPNPDGRVETLSWHGRRGMWGTAGRKDSEYPEYAVFGKYEHFPYLN